MSGFFDNCPMPEPSSLLGFSGNKIDSNTEGRTQSCLSAALDSADSQYIGVCDGLILTRDKGDHATLLLSAGELGAFDPDYSNAIMPGNIDGRAILAVPVQFEVETLAKPYQALDGRSIVYSHSLPTMEAGAAGMATSLLHWHKTNRYCGFCGAPSRSHIGGMRRDCSQCDAQIFPRTDPAVIMLAIRSDRRGERCLLGRSPKFPPNWYSCLAGFVEPGETLEQAIRRETREESGITIGRVKYFASQPWPFPHSLMIGAYCEALDDKISFDGNELEDCRWFGHDEVQAMVEKRHESELRAPPSASIASHIIGNWLARSA